MPNTTNFNWSTPADTDLVKNGASAIRTLGSAIDTSFVDFKGGTTGQVLKKTSGTDLDVEWGTASSGLTLINTTSFSAVASQSINDVFSATYDNYKIIFSDLVSTAASSTITMRLRVSGADNSDNAYRFGRLVIGAGVSQTLANENNAGTTAWTIFFASTTKIGAVIDLWQPFASVPTIGVDFSSGGFFDIRGLNFSNTTSFTGFSFISNTGDLTGKVSVYGYSK
jgi:hypothetical protein